MLLILVFTSYFCYFILCYNMFLILVFRSYFSYFMLGCNMFRLYLCSDRTFLLSVENTQNETYEFFSFLQWYKNKCPIVKYLLNKLFNSHHV